MEAQIDVPVSNLIKKFKNEHLSVSRLERFEQCPLSFYLHYVHTPKLERIRDPGSPAEFGVLLHDVLEHVYQWAIDNEYSGPIPLDKITEFYRDSWNKMGLVGLELYHEGLRILREYAINRPNIDHFSILAVEEEFNIQIDEFIINGYIDRIDKVDDETVKIIDYKSNRLLYTNEQLESNLQMSVYGIVAKRKFPWVKYIEFEFHMLRYGGHPMTARRTEAQLNDAKDYVLYLGRRTENDISFPAQLNMNCNFCDVRKHCPEFKKARELKLEDVGYPVNDTDSLDQIAIERERVSALAKLFYKRKKDLEDIIRFHLQDKPSLEAGGVIYSLYDWNVSKSYPIDATVRAVSRIIQHPAEETLRDICSIDPKKIDLFLERMADVYPKGRVLLLKAEIEALEQKIPGEPRFSSKRSKEAIPISVAQNPGVLPKEKVTRKKAEPKEPKEPKAPRVPKQKKDLVEDLDD